LLAVLISTAPSVLAAHGHRGKSITLIEMGDLHATLLPHSAVFKDTSSPDVEFGRFGRDAGGLARLKTIVDSIRDDDPHSLLLSCGDLTHGSAEGLFTLGDAVIKAMNAFEIDVFTPGNWDFGYGPAVFRNRFDTFGPKPPLPPNLQVMAGYVDCADPADGCTERNGIIQANFPSVALNVYNAEWLPPQFRNQRVLEPYKIFKRKGVKVAVIGITAAIVPQQADVFNIGLRFTQGVEELPEILDMVKAEGADVIVVQSELGLSQNIEIARRFKEIDVMYSAHTHEITLGALLADEKAVTVVPPDTPLSYEDTHRLARGATIVVETNRDLYVGRLDLQIRGRRLVGFNWEAIPVDDTVPEDKAMKALVDKIEAPFLAGPDFIEHVFLPGGFSFANCASAADCGLRLNQSLDTPVGHSEVLLLRHHVLEDPLNNFLADAIYSVTNDAVASAGVPDWGGVDISMTNGFRFGNAVLPGDDVTLRDLYTWYPIGASLNVGDFTGASIVRSLEEILAAVFHRNPFEQRGGWYLGLANMTQKLDLDNRPFSSSSGRIVETTVGQAKLDPSKRYVFGSCYAHGDPIDQVCRTGGGANYQFFALGDAGDYSSPISLHPAKNSENVTVVPPGQVKQVAPDAFLHPVHAVQRYLDSLPANSDGLGVVTAAQYALPADGQERVRTVDSTDPTHPSVPPPLAVPDNTPDETLVQPPFGAGPKFFSGRIGSDRGIHRHRY
ncbi:MAG: 5'-nucleotidase C-terminal domain-containing protein, partial [Pseudomonadota bacterium]